jgi:hypothetical protein
VIRAPTVVGPTTTLATATNVKRTKRRNQLAPTNRLTPQSILVYETAFQFSQSVLSINHSDFPNNPHHHGNDWGEQTQEQEDQQEQDVPEEEQQWSNDESYHDTTPNETTLVSSSASDPGSISTLTVANTKEDSDTECQQMKDASHATLIEPEVTTTLKEPYSQKKDTPTEIDAIQSSSSEPSWGQYRQPTQQELQHEWQVWDKTNQHEQSGTTTAYRHGRCDSCNKKPISSSNLDTTYPLLCLECVPKCVTPEPEKLVQNTKLSYKQGLGKTGRDDEEEWSGIPIPQSDDSDDEYWLDESDESEPEAREDDTGPPPLNLRKPDDDPDDASANLIFLAQQTSISSETKEQKQTSIQNINDYAFLISPRRDGRIQRKDRTILTLQELPNTFNLSHQTAHTPLESITLDSSFPMNFTEMPSWTDRIMQFQKSTLKMGYKNKSKLRSKLMKSTRKTVPTQAHIHWTLPQSRNIDVRPWRINLTAASHALTSLRFDPLTAFLPGAPFAYHQRGPLQQFMNSIRSQNRPKTKLKKQESSHKSKRYFSPITIPVTPTERHTPDDDTALHTKSTTEEEDLNLYYSIYAYPGMYCSVLSVQQQYSDF